MYFKNVHQNLETTSKGNFYFHYSTNIFSIDEKKTRKTEEKSYEIFKRDFLRFSIIPLRAPYVGS